MVFFDTPSAAHRVRSMALVSNSVLRDRVDQVMLDTVPPIGWGLVFLYIGFAIGHQFMLAPTVAAIMTTLAILTATACAAIAIYASQRARPGAAHLLAAILIILILLNSVAHLWITRDPDQTTNLMVLSVGMGSVLLSRRWMAALMCAVLSSYGITVFAIATAEHASRWAHFSFALVTSAVMGALIFIVRQNRVLGLERMALQNQETTRRALESEARFRQLANATQEGIIIHDNGIVIDVNERLLEMFQYKVQHLIGGPALRLIAPTDHELVLHGSAMGDPAREYKVLAVRADGTTFPVQVDSRPIVVGEKQMRVALIRDLSESYELGRIKDEFVATVSHELRTPLTSIRGALGLLTSDNILRQPDKASRLVQLAHQNTNRLIRLINDILDLQRMESGKITLERRECSSTELVEQAVTEMAGLAENGHISIETAVEPVAMYCDPDRIVQTLTNLISNAIKFSEAGSSIGVVVHAGEEFVIFCVQDQGRGIPADKLETIFERFQQVDSSDSRRSGGTGLGLSICRTIVKQHDGRIWAESDGSGSAFYFTIPKALPTRLNSQESSSGSKHIN
jgi:PAS domain S-box-containing protein